MDLLLKELEEIDWDVIVMNERKREASQESFQVDGGICFMEVVASEVGVELVSYCTSA